jgi:hypothetical protein
MTECLTHMPECGPHVPARQQPGNLLLQHSLMEVCMNHGSQPLSSRSHWCAHPDVNPKPKARQHQMLCRFAAVAHF